MASKLRIMSQQQGDATLPMTSPEEIADAQAKFDEVMGGSGRFVAYNVATHGGRRVSEPIAREEDGTTKFDPNGGTVTVEKPSGNIELPAEEILLVPPLAGGS